MQEKLLLDAMYTVPGSDIVRVDVDAAAVRGEAPLHYTRRAPDAAPDAAPAGVEASEPVAQAAQQP